MRIVLLIAGLALLSYSAYKTAARYVYQLQPMTSRRSDRSLVGKIEIPRLKISAIVKEGVDERTLDVAAGHIPDTALPGETGNVGVAAHRDTLFRNLKDVRRDDRIKVTTLDGEYLYRVVSFRIVQPADISVLDPSADEKILTLITCYPFYFVGHAPQRFVVRAVQVL